VSELTGLKIEDIDVPSMSIRVLGKGRRERMLPLWKTTPQHSVPGSPFAGGSPHPRCSSTFGESR